VADTACWGNFGTAGERRFVRAVEVSAGNQGFKIGALDKFCPKVRLRAKNAEKKIKKSLYRIYICMYICIYQTTKKHTYESNR
jgi:hypothetical protein